MLPLVVVIILSAFLLFLPICVCTEYGDQGFSVFLKLFFFKFQLTGKKEKKKKPVEKNTKQKKEKKQGSKKLLMNILTPAMDALGRFVRCLVVKKLVMDISVGGKDAFSAAVSYGGTAAGIGILFPFLDGTLKIKKKFISVNADFTSEDTTVYLLADIRIFSGQLLAIVICFLYKYMKKINTK